MKLTPELENALLAEFARESDITIVQDPEGDEVFDLVMNGNRLVGSYYIQDGKFVSLV